MRLAEAANTDTDWVSFPGGELEGKRPKALCEPCRRALQRAFGADRARRGRKTLCFQCYRAELERERALREAGERNTTSAERFQFQLPLESIDRARLAALKVDRARQRLAAPPTANRRRHAQIEARHALQHIAAGLASRRLTLPSQPPVDGEARAMFEAVHAAELQLPESWLPFVVSR